MTTYDNWMQTRNRNVFHFGGTDTKGISLNDIVYSLCRLPRFTGHTDGDLSVAEHSLAVEQICILLHAQKWGKRTSRHLRVHALLHDAHEAYTGDIGSPFKRFLRDTYGVDLTAIQDQIQQRIVTALELRPLLRREEELIKEADFIALQNERLLYCSSDIPWNSDDPESMDFSHLYRTYYKYGTSEPYDKFTQSQLLARLRNIFRGEPTDADNISRDPINLHSRS